MKKTVKRVGGLLLGGVSLLLVLSACTSPAGTIPAPTLPAATATTVPVTTAPTVTTAPVASAPTATTGSAATATASIAPTSTAGAAATSTSAPANDQLAQGKLIFEKTAGGVGCAYCHGADAKGNGPAKNNAPDIRSKTEADIRAAVAGGVPLMGIVKLTEAEYEAVAAYLATLNK